MKININNKFPIHKVLESINIFNLIKPIHPNSMELGPQRAPQIQILIIHGT